MVRVVDSTADHTVGTLPGAVFHVWRGPTTVRGVTAIRTALEQASRDGSGLRVVLLGVLEPGTPVLDEHERKLLADGMREAVEVHASAFVFEGRGFQASAVRVMVAGLAMMARVPYPHEVFGSVPLAAQRLKRWSPEHDVERLVAGAEALRRAAPGG